MKKFFGRVILLLIFLLLIVIVLNWSTIQKLRHTIALFDKEVIVQNFQNMETGYPSTQIASSPNPIKLPSKDIGFKPIKEFKYLDSLFSVDEYLETTRTEGLLVIQNDTIIYEQYANDLEPDESHISWSMSKSFIAAMMGIAYDNGLYKLSDPVTKYLPQFKGTGYDGVEIEDLLQMSSGVRFNEDYGDFNSDINKFGRAFAMGSSLEAFAQDLERQRTPGTYNHYVSLDTQVLGILLIKLTGKSITQLTQEWIWNPMGFEHEGQWITDNEGLELALGGLNASLRDYAKMGLLYLNKGKFNGKQIVSEEWVQKSLSITEDHLQPNQKKLSSNHHGYGYQWWIPQHDEGDFFMVGIYNQFVYVQPKHNLVIVKLSANHHFKEEGKITKDIHLALFKSMARTFEQKESVNEI
jgi:CubicO group peptidase (beta-lactamase class C family)